MRWLLVTVVAALVFPLLLGGCGVVNATAEVPSIPELLSGSSSAPFVCGGLEDDDSCVCEGDGCECDEMGCFCYGDDCACFENIDDYEVGSEDENACIYIVE